MNKPYQSAANEGEKLQIEFIKERLEEWKWSVNRLSRETGIAVATLTKWINLESKISHNNFLQVLGALEIRPYLVPAEVDKNKIIRIDFN